MKSIISSIESGCHAHTIDICDENGYDKRFDSTMFLITYSSITSKILYNLQKNDINRPLVNKIINGELDLYYLATLSSEELCPEANAKIRENLELRKQQKIKKNICDLYTCSKCKHNKTTTYTKQTRALDEGMTTFVQCENCHYKWTL
jgi:DNA-directed RNA polymerase subunit M/transcription elongation factor TFIIS